MGHVIHLHAESLFSKWGFCDGDVLDDILWDLYEGYTPNDYVFEGKSGAECDHGFSHALLIELVKQKLLPELPVGFKIHHLSTCHNPVRADEDMDEDSVSGLYATVTTEDVMAVIKGMTGGADAAS